MAEFTHFDKQGKAVMVDVSGKDVTERTATAAGSVVMQPETSTIRDAPESSKCVRSLIGLSRYRLLRTPTRT